MRRLWSVLTLFALAPVLAPELGSQEPVYHPAVSFDVTAGAGGVAGGSFQERFVLAADATVAVRLRQYQRGDLLIAGSGGVQGPTSNTAVCDAPPELDCVSEHPVFWSTGLLAGWEFPRRGSFVTRVLAGPAWFETDRGDGTGGMQARLDIAVPTPTHYGLALSVRGALLPSFEGSTLAFGALGIGFRIR